MTPRRPHHWFWTALTYGLGRKLVFSFGAVLAAFVVVAFFVNIGTQRSMISGRLDERSNELAKLLTEISSSYLFELRVSDLEIILEDIQRQPDIEYVRVIDPDGFVLATGTIGDSTFLTRDDSPVVTRVQDTRQVVVEEFDGIRHLTAPIQLGSDYLGTVRIGLSLLQFRTDISVLQSRNALIGGTFLTLGLLVSILMSKHLTRPLRRLIELARLARNGDLHQSLELNTNDEIETLAAEFGEMLKALRSTMGEINRLAYTDSLTGLRNRAWFNDFLKRIVGAAETERSAILFLDLDKFKNINDTHGHDVGDHVLIEMATRLRKVLRAQGLLRSDVSLLDLDGEALESTGIGIARLGGDEFTILIRNIPDKDAVAALAESVVATMRQPFDVGRATFKTSASVGIAFIPEHGSSAQDILKSADVAMYQAKKAGRDTYRIFDPANAAEVSDRRLLEQNLIVGIAEGQLVIEFQPQFDLVERKPVAAEALVRWRHPTAGLIQPADFLPLAEDAGLMGNIDRFVISESLRLATGWPSIDGVPLRLAVNVGVRELSNRDFVSFVLAQLRSSGFAPDRLEIEVTEGTAMEENAAVEASIRRLRGAGVRFAVDDFGIGYSNLSRLKSLQFETLKIDRSLLSGVGTDPIAEAVVKSLLQLSEALKLEIVAAGVERSEQYAFLKAAGCHQAQGFGLARPMSNAELFALLSCDFPLAFFAGSGTEPAMLRDAG